MAVLIEAGDVARRPSGREVRAFLRRLLRQLRANWPRVEILLRADSHYCGPEVLRWCRANKVDYLLGVAPTSTLRRHVENLEASTAARFAASDGSTKLRRFTEFYDGAASWDRVERIIARVEAGPDGADTRFVVTSLWNSVQKLPDAGGKQRPIVSTLVRVIIRGVGALDRPGAR